MTRIEREYRALCQSEGLDLQRLEHRGRHYALHFAVGFVIAGATPSDRRNRLNLRAQLRRLHR